MALKPHRSYNVDDTIAYFATGVMVRGGIASVPAASALSNPSGIQGESLDFYQRQCIYTNSPSGCKPLGILLVDVVDLDPSRVLPNPYKAETLIGSKVPLAYRGEFQTNFIGPGQASGIAVPADAYLGPSGLIYTSNFTSSGWNKVGQVMTNIDSDGYATLRVDIR